MLSAARSRIDGNPQTPIYDFSLGSSACKRRSRPRAHSPFPFTLTARAENFLHGRKDIDDTIKRLQAFEAAGADAVFARPV